MTQAANSEDKFRALLESAPDAMVIVNQAGEIVLVNAQTERLFGYQRRELLGQRVEMLVPARYRGAHVGHRQGYVPGAHPQERAKLLHERAAHAEANRIKDEFLATLSHELRTPLNAILGWTTPFTMAR